MTTAFRQIHELVLVALRQAPAVAGGRVHGGRARPMPAEHESDINVSIEPARGQQVLVGAGVDWNMTLGVEVRARGSSAVNALDALDPVFELAYARIGGLALAMPPGVMAFEMSPQITVEVDEADTPVASLRLALQAQFRTQPGTLLLAP